MQHRGEIIKSAIYKSGYSITYLSKRLSKSKRWVYLMFKKKEVSLDLILQIGKIIHHDFTEEIKVFDTIKNKPEDNQNNNYWKNKYLTLLENFNELLKEFIQKK